MAVSVLHTSPWAFGGPFSWAPIAPFSLVVVGPFRWALVQPFASPLVGPFPWPPSAPAEPFPTSLLRAQPYARLPANWPACPARPEAS